MMEKKKRITREEKMNLLVIDLINKMFECAGHNVTYDDIKDREDDWYTEWTMTMDQNKEWMEWGRNEIKTRLKWSNKIAEKEMAMINLMWGLKYSDFVS
jgi:hypothetical protein